MEAKPIFAISPQRGNQSPKYPTLKKSQDTMKDIAFRLNFSPIKNQERSINHVLNTFEKPFATLGMDSDTRKQFNQIIQDLQTIFNKIKESPNPDLNKEFWIQWNNFDKILHQISTHSAYYYCSREIERLTLDIIGAIKSIRSNPPAIPGIQHEFSLIVEKVQKSFIQIVDRFAQICDSKIDETQKVRDLESMRNQLRQFRSEITGDKCKFFSLSSASHANQDKSKKCIESSLTTIISAISDLKRQAYLLDNLDSEIANAMRVIEMMIDGEPLPNARSERIKDSVKMEKENFAENEIENEIEKEHVLPSKVKVPRRCTINPSSKKEKGITKRSSRRRQSIKRNSLLIDLTKSSSDDSDGSFCSSLSEFQDGKELLFDSDPISLDISDIEENDAMYQLSDDEEGEKSLSKSGLSGNQSNENLFNDEVLGSNSFDVSNEQLSNHDPTNVICPTDNNNEIKLSPRDCLLEEPDYDVPDLQFESIDSVDKCANLIENMNEIDNGSNSVNNKNNELHEEANEKKEEKLNKNDNYFLSEGKVSTDNDDKSSNEENKSSYDEEKGSIEDDKASKKDQKYGRRRSSMLSFPLQLTSDYSAGEDLFLNEDDSSAIELQAKDPLVFSSSLFCIDLLPPIFKLSTSEAVSFELCDAEICQPPNKTANIMNVLFIWAVIIILVLFFKLKCQ
ncbi:hypothetical protein TRFO_08712 [Tritrichomonas foetus]|uniref:Uncharacterized protein n=1 Tax=Tritrichomonas foetus TaxID=1144522 RepID=A0A1J4JK28_9EUKA|nr:hypothetical protein TRFO_08712 [Tritrichomonas foetus]|eukprot:OHS98719.1 hypothetical protein TRFO_08712 [Tritrichomonas foetus]